MKPTASCVVICLLLAACASGASAQTRLRIPDKVDGETSIAVPAERVKHSDENIKLLPKPPRKTKRARNKAGTKRREPVSEYKFERTDRTPAYKFDRKTNPIIKGGRRAKKAARKTGKKKKSAPVKPARAEKAPRFSAGETGTKAESGAGAEDGDGKLQFLFEDDPQAPPEE